MRKVITINIPKPCKEDWNKMTLKDQGRHCAACRKTVVDFTKQTDEQIIKSLKLNENLCGRFKNQQLNREVIFARKNKNNYLSWAASGLFAFLTFGNQDIYAQGEPVKTDTIIRGMMIKGKVATSILTEPIYVGQVIASDDGLPLPGASVTVKGTSRGIHTDFDGNFKIKAKIGEIIEFSYVGMVTQKILLSANSVIKIALIGNNCLDEVSVGQVTYDYKCHREEAKTRRTEEKKERRARKKAIKKGEQPRTTFGKLFFKIKSLFIQK